MLAAETLLDNPEERDAPLSARLRVALAGNPNCGKTSLFNAMTGAHQHVGNYPGVTVEKRIGNYRVGAQRVQVLDLPGTYSLTSYSPEERVAQFELVEQRHDVVVVVADSTNLKRGLVLLAQVMQTGAKTVLCLNMADEARAAGQHINVEQMATLLGFPVVETEGHRGVGVDRLKDAVAHAASAPAPTRQRVVLGERMDQALAEIRAQLAGHPRFDARAHDWVATKLLMGDHAFQEAVRAGSPAHEAVIETAARCRQHIEADTRQDIALFVTERTFGFVDGLLREVMHSPARADARAVSDRIDAVLVHRLLGLPIFALVMYAIFWVTFTLGDIPMRWIERGFGALGEGVSLLWSEGNASPLHSLLVDGVIAGVGGVLVFLPNILLLFLGLAFLEDTGYMARAAFLMDRVMHRFGLHGKSFIPMLTGFGCSIPGIMATRTLENERDRLTTMLVLPLMSCGARLPIWLLLIPAFFPPMWRAPMLFFIYAVGIVLALALALLLRKSVLRGEDAPFVMELPPYRLPTARAVVFKMSERVWLYLRKAGTIILGISILMWFISSYPKPHSYAIDAAVAAGQVQILPLDDDEEDEEEDAAGTSADAQRVARERERAQEADAPAGVRVLSAEQVDYERGAEALRTSIAGRIGRTIEPLIKPLGFDWKIATAMLGAFAAKEVFVAQLGIVYSMGKVSQDSDSLRLALQRDYSPLVALSLMIFLLIATPCMATVAVTRRESGRWRWSMLQFWGLTMVAYVSSLAVFQIGRWMV